MQKITLFKVPEENWLVPACLNSGRVTHTCVSKLTIIGSDNGLSPGRRQVIIWTNAGILLIGPLGTGFSEIWNGIQTFSFKKMHLKMSSISSWLQCVNRIAYFALNYRHGRWAWPPLVNRDETLTLQSHLEPQRSPLSYSRRVSDEHGPFIAQFLTTLCL